MRYSLVLCRDICLIYNLTLIFPTVCIFYIIFNVEMYLIMLRKWLFLVFYCRNYKLSWKANVLLWNECHSKKERRYIVHLSFLYALFLKYYCSTGDENTSYQSLCGICMLQSPSTKVVQYASKTLCLKLSFLISMSSELYSAYTGCNRTYHLCLSVSKVIYRDL